MASLNPSQSLTAAGNASQTNALALDSRMGIQLIGTCTSTNNSVQMPSAPPGSLFMLVNQGVYQLNVYPRVGGSISGLATNAADVILPGNSANYTTADGLNWVCVGTGSGNGGTRSSLVPVVAVSANTTLTQAQSGSAVNITGTAGAQITLPAAQAGLKYRFINGGLTTANASILTPASANILQGTLQGADTAVLCANKHQINFVAGTSLLGDYVEILCADGTNWQVIGQAQVAASFTVA